MCASHFSAAIVGQGMEFDCVCDYLLDVVSGRGVSRCMASIFVLSCEHVQEEYHKMLGLHRCAAVYRNILGRHSLCSLVLDFSTMTW